VGAVGSKTFPFGAAQSVLHGRLQVSFYLFSKKKNSLNLNDHVF
jgi:hypothetical protein